MKTKTDPNQLDLLPVVMTTVVSTGNGTFRVEVGKPLLWLSPLQTARQFGVSRDTIYNWINDGTIPKEMWERRGKLKLGISAEAIPLLKKKFGEI